ncbi:branched-chain amino acid aminotransferase [Sphingobium sufflavum]|uniref:branched-chain amino acid aminotransferase n=1 Tax=Sphingobium sufflavum TaxID=1129547 RepID=UPI001F335C9D|nr:branched-chain amino acid aminotransferase [Sphingobium sufflavum]MCE7795754.1 branched-chain amino acid aminotransferase [Sphingobium sufflavum]
MNAFSTLTHSAPTSAEDRAALLAEPGFGKVFTDHMVTIRYTEGQGWHDATLGPRGPIALDPAAAVLHYAQEIFEGLKAYRLPDGGIGSFRPDANARRFNQSARRLAMPEIPEELFVESIRQIVQADAGWTPSADKGSLYLRPFMFADEAFLGVRPAKSYIFCVIASPVGGYFKGGKEAVTLWVSHDYVRAVPGGTGSAKCGGNYAASLLPQAHGIAEGCDQVLFLDAVERRYIEELGGMNIMFVMTDGSIITPPLDGSILPGITRDSLIALAGEAGYRIREERYSFEQWEEDTRSGALKEAFACGTAAVITPIGEVRSNKGGFVIGNGAGGDVARMLKEKLVGIQYGRVEDSHGWLERLA